MAAPSEPVTWKRIGVTDRRCRECGQALVLEQVRRFGTDERGRFVECGECFNERTAAPEFVATPTPSGAFPVGNDGGTGAAGC